eukprot:g15009.t1
MTRWNAGWMIRPSSRPSVAIAMSVFAKAFGLAFLAARAPPRTAPPLHLQVPHAQSDTPCFGRPCDAALAGCVGAGLLCLRESRRRSKVVKHRFGKCLRPAETETKSSGGTAISTPKILVVNLDRSPQRWESAQDEFRREGVQVERFSGTDGKALSAEELKKFATRSSADAEKKYGEDIYEPKSQRPDRLRLAHLPGAALIEFLAREVEAGSKKKPDTMIMAKKKQAKALTDKSVRVEVLGVDVKDEAKEDKAAKSVTEEVKAEGEMVVDPWSVKGKIDYEKLIRDFGSTKTSDDLLERIRKITVGSGRVSDLHCWLRRNIFFSHRELDAICALQDPGIEDPG